MSDLQRRIEYIIDGDGDTESKAERITSMIESRDRHIAKLAQIGMAQEAEITRLKSQDDPPQGVDGGVEALEARGWKRINRTEHTP